MKPRSIQTYGGRGVTETGPRKSNFAIIYSGSIVPKPLEGELARPGEMRTPIKINAQTGTDGLHPTSRLNLRAIHVAQQNWQVFKVGTIADESWETLWQEHRAVLGDSGNPAEQTNAQVYEEMEMGGQQATDMHWTSTERLSATSNAGLRCSPGSITSEAYSAWSGATLAADDPMAHELAEFLWLNQHCQILSVAGVGSSQIGKERFQNNLRRLLVRFAKDLASEAHEKDHYAAASLVQHATRSVANEIAARAVARSAEKGEVASIVALCTDCDSDDEELQPQSENNDEYHANDYDEDENPQIDTRDVTAAKHFLETSNAFQTLLQSLGDFVQPAFHTVLTSLFKRR